MSHFKFIDLFAGIWWLRQAFDSIWWKCVFTSEWDLACQKTYAANYNCDINEIAWDITKISEKDIPSHDVLLAWFPCQPFSIAWVSKRNSLWSPHWFLCWMQGTLFFDVARIIAHHKPKAFLLENVKNLISHDKWNTFKVILKTLKEDLWYNVQYKVINAKWWVPQNRQRIYIVWFLDKNDFDFDTMKILDSEKWPKLSSILHSEDSNETSEEPYTLNWKVNDKYVLSTKLWKYLQDYADKHKIKWNGFWFTLNWENDVARTLSARYYKDGSEILIKRWTWRPRRLTPRECARIMWYNNNFKIPVSDTQAYKQFWNSVVVPVVKAVAKHMKPYILNSKKTKWNIETTKSLLKIQQDKYSLKILKK